MPARTRAAPFAEDRALIGAFRAALEGVRFTADEVMRAVGGEGDGMAPRPHQIPLIERRLDHGPLATVIRLFLLGATVAVDRARASLAPLTLERCVALGVLERRGDRVRGTVRLIPGAGTVIACDREPDDPSRAQPDHVMGVAPSSRLLSNLTIRRTVDLALDLGTGCGYQALGLATHARRVIATDIEPRAVAFARFNATLNGRDNVECLQGDRFAPVEGIAFDLIVSNPPFVISPDRALTYRDSGLGADRISRAIVQEAPRHLRAGGIAQVLISWLHPARGDWAEPLREWAKDSGADAWFLRAATHDPLSYATSWQQPLAGDPARYAAAIQRWLEYFGELHAEAIGYGAAVLRRRAGAGWTRADDLPAAIAADAGADLAALLEAEDRLRDLDDAGLLASVLEVSPHRLDQTMRWHEGLYEVERAVLIRDTGLRPSADVDLLTAQLVAAIDGRRSLREAIDAAIEAVGEAPRSMDVPAIAAARRLIAYGFLRSARLPD